jgi:hypothetical protein
VTVHHPPRDPRGCSAMGTTSYASLGSCPGMIGIPHDSAIGGEGSRWILSFAKPGHKSALLLQPRTAPAGGGACWSRRQVGIVPWGTARPINPAIRQLFPRSSRNRPRYAVCAGGLFRPQWPKFELVLERNAALRVFGHCRSEALQKMLTTLATLTAPVVVLTILIIAVCEIRDAWDRNRIK